MRFRNSWSSALFTTALALAFCAVASAAPIIDIDEFGNGSIDFGNGPVHVNGSLQQDPGPGGLPAALTYVLNAPGLTAGDLFLTDGGMLEDLIRFNPAGSGGAPSYLSSIVFYSSGASAFDSAADTAQLPFGTYTNVFTLAETVAPGGDGATYTPASGQPGYVSGFSVTYNITSSVVTSSVPEPSSIFLMCSGAAGFLLWRRKRQL